ncbi:MAG: GTPase Era [Pseudomonadota bacterium]
MDKSFRSGYISVVGLPNVGKSTLINRILDTKILAVSEKPQTTRNNILGIFTSPGAQMLFVDTPGYHNAGKDINKFFVKEAVAACKTADVIVYMFDGSMTKKKGLDANDAFIEAIRSMPRDVKIIPLLSKIDLIKDREIKEFKESITKKYSFKEPVHIVSVPQSLGIAELMKRIGSMLPEGPLYYPEENLTDRDSRFLCSELIREKIFKLTQKEVPYSTAVQIDDYREEGKLHKIYATIYVEKDSQKGILIGKNGGMLKKIGTDARVEIEKMVGSRVYLELYVKVRKDWTSDDRSLAEFGYK